MRQPDMAYRPLSLTTLAPRTGYASPFFAAPNPVKVSAYALEVMTDLRFVPVASIRPGATLEVATQRMIARGVRLLLVVDDDDKLVGLITARDTEGERPAAVAAREGIAVGQIGISQVMTPAAEIEVLQLEEVLHARVGDIVATLKHSWRQHALVQEEDPYSGMPLIRGIFSASQIARQLGIAPQLGELSHTFADIDRAIALHERKQGGASA